MNGLHNLIRVMAPVIHRAIVSKLANSPLFQHLAWTGTQAVKDGAKKGGEAVKSTNAYRTASYKAQELKQTEAYKEAANSSAGRFAQEAWRELRGQNRLQK